MFYEKTIHKSVINKQTLRNFIIIVILYASSIVLHFNFNNVWTIILTIFSAIILIIYSIYSSIKIDKSSEKIIDEKVNQLCPDEKVSSTRIL